MKIAKKVLAVVMAVAMIAALSAMAFAADGAKVVLKVGEIDADGYIPVTIALKNGIGAKAVKIDLEYDKAVFEYDSDSDEGTDAAALKLTKNNKDNVGATNGNEAGKIQYGYAFANSLLTSEEFAKDAQRGKTVTVNSDEFTFTTLYFKVLGDAASSEIKISADIDGVKISDTASIKLKDEPVETQPVEVATTAVEADTKASNPPTGDKTTGDNMALAAAAGVVVLAGAAFIISKKRK